MRSGRAPSTAGSAHWLLPCPRRVLLHRCCAPSRPCSSTPSTWPRSTCCRCVVGGGLRAGEWAGWGRVQRHVPWAAAPYLGLNGGRSSHRYTRTLPYVPERTHCRPHATFSCCAHAGTAGLRSGKSCSPLPATALPLLWLGAHVEEAGRTYSWSVRFAAACAVCRWASAATSQATTGRGCTWSCSPHTVSCVPPAMQCQA